MIGSEANCVGLNGFKGELGSLAGKPPRAVGLIGLAGDDGSAGGNPERLAGDRAELGS